MTLSTTTAAFTISPVVCATLIKHWRRKLRKRNIRNSSDTEAVDDLLFEEAFNIVKAFLELATRNTLESLQSFTNTHVPPPFWAECVSCTVPLPCCNKAADILIDWFGPDELRKVVGGDRWWQVRGLEGAQAEWVAMKRDWDKLEKAEKRVKRSNSGRGQMSTMFSERLNHLRKVVFYIHGGGFYFGSINTHRYQVIRIARKLGGRAFAVNYRKSPQYPWPCPLQDVLAGYLYLIQPPPGAPHAAVDPQRLVVAGDSAGGNLALSLLVVLRDMGLPMPAGAVLISPWVDLTHSFPSIMRNTATDIIPPNGFLHKPSTLWPLQSSGPAAVQIEQDTGRPREFLERQPSDLLRTKEISVSPGSTLNSRSNTAGPPISTTAKRTISETVAELAKDSIAESLSSDTSQAVRVEVDGRLLEIRSQFQIYATNGQITHPLVSPLWNSSLGGLCPLYIVAGDHEVLRDEIVYLAHRAADPARFPLREGLLLSDRQKENVEKYKQGTQVHFQLFDDMCHVLTVFSFTNSANFAYRGIARFAKRVMEEKAETVASDPFPTTQLAPPLTDVAVPISRTPSGLDAKESPSTRKGDHVGREKVKGQSMSEDDTVLEPNPEGETREAGTITILCERVSIHGIVRPLECDDEIPALHIAPAKLGLIKDEPVKRWLEGQTTTSKKWRGREVKIQRRRKIFHESALRFIKDKRLADGHLPVEKPLMSGQMAFGDGADREMKEMQEAAAYYRDLKRRWSPFDLEGETPSPSAIVGRTDTPDAIALLELAFEIPPAPVSPKKKRFPLVLSPAEQQRFTSLMPGSHGVRLWSTLMSKFMNTNVKKETTHTDTDTVDSALSPTEY